MRLRSTDKFPRRPVDSSSSPARRYDGVREDPLESTARSTMEPGSPRLTFRSFISRRGTRAADVAPSNEIFFSDLSATTIQRRRKPPLLPVVSPDFSRRLINAASIRRKVMKHANEIANTRGMRSLLDGKHDA